MITFTQAILMNAPLLAVMLIIVVWKVQSDRETGRQLARITDQLAEVNFNSVSAIQRNAEALAEINATLSNYARALESAEKIEELQRVVLSLKLGGEGE